MGREGRGKMIVVRRLKRGFSFWSCVKERKYTCFVKKMATSLCGSNNRSALPLTKWKWLIWFHDHGWMGWLGIIWPSLVWFLVSGLYKRQKTIHIQSPKNSKWRPVSRKRVREVVLFIPQEQGLLFIIINF